MRDYLLDLVEHTHDLGFIDLIKITGDDKTTEVVGIPSDVSVVVQGEFKNPVPEFIGNFGMPNLAKLKIILNLPEYRENATLSRTYDKEGVLDGVEFVNSIGDFRNNYRYMSADIVNKKIGTMRFKGATWHLELEPTVVGIQRLKMQAQANAEEQNFQARTDNGHLKFFFGDHSTHAGDFVFQPDVGSVLKRSWYWPVKQVISILDLTGDKVMRFSDDGLMQITVDSGLAVYNYNIPAQSK